MGLRERLRERELPQATVGIRIDWSEESYRLHQELDQVKQRLYLADASGTEAPELREQVDRLQARVDAMYELVTVRAIAPSDMEQLVSAHPPTDEQRAKDPTVGFNRDSFFPALLAACIEGPESPQDWEEMINSGELVTGEVNVLIQTAMELNDRSPNVILGKGSTTISS